MNMIRRVLQQLGREGYRVHLQPDERQQGRQQLLEFMASHPLRTLPATRTNGFVWHALRPAFWLRPALLAGCLVVAVGASTVTAAEQALPGELLYGVKIYVTEGVRGWLAVTQEAKARLAVSRTQRRLEETTRLAASQRMDAEVLGAVETRLQAQADQTTHEIERLQAKGNAEVAAQLSSTYEAVIKVNELLLQSIESTVQAHQDDRDKPRALAPVISQLQAQGAAAASVRSDAEAQVADAPQEKTRVAAERKLKSVNKSLESVRAQLDRRRSRLTTEAAAQLEAQVDQAQLALTDGQETLEVGAYGAAFARFQVAERTATRAGLLLKAQEQLRVQVPLRQDAVKAKSKSVEADEDRKDNDGERKPAVDRREQSQNDRNNTRDNEAKQSQENNSRQEASKELKENLEATSTGQLQLNVNVGVGEGVEW